MKQYRITYEIVDKVYEQLANTDEGIDKLKERFLKYCDKFNLTLISIEEQTNFYEQLKMQM